MKTIKIFMLILGMATTMVACNDESDEVKPDSIEMSSPAGGNAGCKGDC